MKTLILVICLACCAMWALPNENTNATYETYYFNPDTLTSNSNISSDKNESNTIVDVESSSSVEPELEPESNINVDVDVNVEQEEVDKSSKDEDLDIIVQDVFYELTLDERTLIEKVVMAESGTESYIGQCMIAQCIIDACKLENKRPPEIIIEYQYTKKRVNPSDSVKKAVAAVFDDGFRVTYEKTLYFYAPKLCVSKWHESMNFIIQIGNVRFFN